MSCDLTVCICAYNAEKYIAETLESLKNQTYKNFKLLIVNDCSNDRTVEIAESFSTSGWGSFEIVNMECNHGTAFCRNFALNYVKTDLMMFFDADDIAQPELIQILINKICSEHDLIVVGCYCNYMDENGKKLNGGIYLGPTDRDTFLRKAEAGKMFFLTPPSIFQREYAIKAGGYRQAQWFPANSGIRYEDMSEDVDLWGRMSDFYTEGKYIIVIPQTLYFYRKLTNSLSSGFEKSRVMGQKIMYIKHIQLKRRKGLAEDTFEQFWGNLPLMKKISPWKTVQDFGLKGLTIYSIITFHGRKLE